MVPSEQTLPKHRELVIRDWKECVPTFLMTHISVQYIGTIRLHTVKYYRGMYRVKQSKTHAGHVCTADIKRRFVEKSSGEGKLKNSAIKR